MFLDRLADQDVAQIAAETTVEQNRGSIAKICDALRGAAWRNRRRCHDADVVAPAMDDEATALQLDPVKQRRERAARLRCRDPLLACAVRMRPVI